MLAWPLVKTGDSRESESPQFRRDCELGG